jgi:hypothetical protein
MDTVDCVMAVCYIFSVLFHEAFSVEYDSEYAGKASAWQRLGVRPPVRMEMSHLSKIQNGSGVRPLQSIHRKDSLRAKPSGPNLNTHLSLVSLFFFIFYVYGVHYYDDCGWQTEGMERIRGSNAMVLWRIEPLLGNDSVNTFPREPTRATIGRLLLSKGSVNKPKTIWENGRRCFQWGPPRGYLRRSSKGAECCQEFGRVLEMAGQGDWEEMRRK